ncbi:MAG TPA: hypothetical protein VMV49_06715 [Candidatus Deferrimicrobium sp.]|nr:hypothetical protein [Candidatus Deferrimicrobium sp.]
MSEDEKITRMKEKVQTDVLKDFPEMEGIVPEITTDTYQGTRTRSRYGRGSDEISVRVLKYTKEIPTFRGITFKKIVSVTVDEETEEVLKVAESRE